ncbi:cytochrome P450 [Nakamurella alba]|nr:cytochrome P450 [Nakamurella alba]
MPRSSPARVAHDQTVRLLRNGCPFTATVRAGSGVIAVDQPVALRLVGRRAVLIGGPAGVRTFYDETLIRRRGATPAFLQNTLFGRNAVHGLDDETHRSRKRLFLDLITDDAAADMHRRALQGWRAELAAWPDRGTVWDAAVRIFGTAVQGWAGVGPGGMSEIPDLQATRDRRSRDLATIVDGFGSVGVGALRARAARRRADRWATAAVLAARSHLGAQPPTPLTHIAGFRDTDGHLLPERTAGVELLNILRPTVAVAWFAVFGALALIRHPDLRDRLSGSDESSDMLRAVANEIRRTTPFVPLLAGKARKGFRLGDVQVRTGTRVLLDVPGTNMDPGRWSSPESFRPERFLQDPGAATSDHFVPQGGGDRYTGHRCPGEPFAVELVTATLRALSESSWTVPHQDLTVDARRIPTRPAGGIRLLVQS